MTTYNENRLLDCLFELQKKSMELWQGLWPQELVSRAMEVLEVMGGQPMKIQDTAGGPEFSVKVLDQEEQESSSGAEPMLHITETGKELLVTVALPGLQGSGDIAVKASGDLLIISAKSATAAVADKGQGDVWYTRRIRLPADVEAEGATAKYQNEVLVLHLPKKVGGVDHIKVKFS